MSNQINKYTRRYVLCNNHTNNDFKLCNINNNNNINIKEKIYIFTQLI